MSTYFQVKGRNEIAIDDNFHCPKFLKKFHVVVDEKVNKWRQTPFSKKIEILRFRNLRDIGIDLDTNHDNIIRTCNEIIPFIRPYGSSNYEVIVSPVYNTVERDISYYQWQKDSELEQFRQDDGYYSIIVHVSGSQQFECKIALYTSLPLTPARIGLLAYNSGGELIFDASKGYLQHLKSISGVNVGANVEVAATHYCTLPDGLNPNNIFISCKSPIPYYAAYKISASGVSSDASYYFPNFSVDGNTLKIELKTNNVTSYTNSATWYNHFFETLIYCPFPENVLTLTP